MIELTGTLRDQWKVKHRELQETGRWELAGLFGGHLGPNFRAAKQKILYVGKATAGEFREETADELFFKYNGGAFWSFAKRLSRLTGGNSDTLEHIGWSNLFKIGVARGNPDGGLVEAQRDLAVTTLAQEWRELKPTLVVCVTENYYEDVVYEALGVKRGRNDGIQQVERVNGTFWIRPAMDEMPALLWMRHPQGKTLNYLLDAENLARQILEGSLPA